MTLRIKVIHLVEDLKVGGQEKVIASIATGLDPKKFDVEIWCLARGGAVADRLRQAGISVRILNLSTYHRPLNIARLALRLRRSRADIVHTHGNFASTFGRLAAILARIRRVVAHVHTSDFSLSRRHILIEKILACFTRHIICVSRSVQNFVKNIESIPAKKTCVIYNGVARLSRPEGKPISRSIWGFGDKDCVVVSVGSLVENKGHRLLIDAVRMLVPAYPSLRLLIVGDGPLRSALEEQVGRFKLSEHIKFTGIVKDIHPVLALADIFALPTRYREGLSLAVLEAMQHGLAVIATRIGGSPEAVEHNRSGLLVPPGDAGALGDAIARLSADTKLRCAMGAQGKKRYEEQFRADQMVSRVESLYHLITAGGERIAV
jgi:glycosyltransferase involved in cell wall biosynthesis